MNENPESYMWKQDCINPTGHEDLYFLKKPLLALLF